MDPVKRETMKKSAWNKALTVFLLSLLICAGMRSELWALTITTKPPPGHPALSAFSSTVTGSVTSTVTDGNLFHFDITLDEPYRFGEFFVLLNPGQALATPSLEDIISPDGWDRYGFFESREYVAFQTQNMSDKNLYQSQNGFQVRLNSNDPVIGYGFHIKETGTQETYFALLTPTLIPEPGTLLLISSGLVVLFRNRKHHS